MRLKKCKSWGLNRRKQLRLEALPVFRKNFREYSQKKKITKIRVCAAVILGSGVNFFSQLKNKKKVNSKFH